MREAMVGGLALVALVTAWVDPALAQAGAGKRVALVVGIGDYRDPLVGRLEHPEGDADAVAQKLRNLGFDVVEHIDPTKQRLLAALDAFVKDQRGADAVLVYFTGHGLQIGGRNFLLPVDANFDNAAALRQSALALDEIVVRAAEVAPRRIILLDACRDDPTSRVPKADPALPVGSGLGRIGRADGTIYAFSTAPGATAEDGHGDHSPFAEALLAHLGDKGLEFGSVMKLVQMEVYDRTAARQLPYVEDALPALFFAGSASGPLPERDRLLLAMAKIDEDTRGQVERVAKTSDVPLAPLYGALLAGAALSHNDSEARERLLAQAAEDFIKARVELGTLASSDPEVTRLRLEAEHALSLGALEAARSALTHAIEVDQGSVEALESRIKLRKLSEAASRAARAGVARTHVEYRVAARDFSAAAEIAERWDRKDLAWQYKLEQGETLRNLGYELGDNAALAEAIEIYGEALKLARREVRPSDWAATQDHLGNALRALGERESGAARLEQAIAAFREALKERTRERAPLDWAATETGLGLALARLGNRESGTARLEEAVTAFRDALEEQNHERAPLDWARTQNSLGLALWQLGARESGTARLEEAVAAFREAQKGWTHQQVPLQWATAQNNVGIVLMAIGERESGTTHLEEALAAFREALKVHTRERMPLEWARHQANIGNVLVQLGFREGGTARLEGAVAAFHEALKERTRERVPLEWAATQADLGNAARTLGERQSGSARLEEAVAAYREALKELTRDRVPLQWANTQIGLGNALQTLGERETGAARLEEAIAAYHEAQKELSRERMPLEWAVTQNNVGRALMVLGTREAGTTHLEEALAAFREALKEHTRERVPLEWARHQANIGNVLVQLGARESGTARLEGAAEAFHESLQERTRERVPLEWAATQAGLGRALAVLGVRTDNAAELEEAVAAYEEALKEHTRDRVPLEWASAIGSQGVALMHLAERTKDAAMADRAVQQIKTALETVRASGQAPNASYYEARLTEARAIRDRLKPDGG